MRRARVTEAVIHFSTAGTCDRAVLARWPPVVTADRRGLSLFKLFLLPAPCSLLVKRNRQSAEMAAQALHEENIDEVILGDEETEIEMMLRIEAEERAKLDAEDADDVQTLQTPPGQGGRTTSERLSDLMSRCSGSSGTGSSAGRVDLSSVAYRFGLLGVMSFGGSPSQVALMRSQPWRSELADDAAFMSLVALCDCLPGFSAAQVATALGVLQAGLNGGLVAVGAYAVAGTLAMALLGTMHLSMPVLGHPVNGGAALLGAMQMGVAAAAVALVAKSALQLSAVHATEALPRAVCLIAAALSACLPHVSWLPPAVLAGGAVVSAVERWWKARAARLAGAEDENEEGRLKNGDNGHASPDERAAALRAGHDSDDVPTTFVPLSSNLGIAFGMLWIGLWVLLVSLRASVGGYWLSLLEGMYRSGGLVWGGGTAVLPLLVRETTPDLLPSHAFLEAVAFGHALPGASTLNLAAYSGGWSAGTLGALLSAMAIHTPGVLVLYAALPFWKRLRASAWSATVLRGVNAASTGMVIATALLLLQSANTPPQHAVGMLTFASLHLGWPAKAMRCAPRHYPAMTVALGATLGVPFCLPWLLGSQATAVTTHRGTPAAARHTRHDETSPPPPLPFSADPSPPFAT